MAHGNLIYDANYHPVKFMEMSKEGKSLAQILSVFGVSRRCYYNWREEYPEFLDAAEIGRIHAQARAEETLDKLAMGEMKGNVLAQIFKMKAQFKEDYQEKQVVQLDATLTLKNLPDEQLNKQLAAKLKLLSAEERAQMLPFLGTMNEVIEGELVE